MKLRKITSLLVVLILILGIGAVMTACGDKEESSAGASNDGGLEADASNDGGLETVTPGKLTIATGNPAWEPWIINDTPESGEGYEAAVAYAVAEELGFAKEDVLWIRTDFDAAIQPGAKDFDFNLQQFSITAERAEIVDFSSPYYKEPLVVIAKQDSAFAGAKSIADLKDALFGAASGDIAVNYTTEKIAPTQTVQVYNNLSDVFAALNSGQIDAAIVGLLTGDYVINIEGEQVTDGIVIGSIAGSEDSTDGLGLLLEKDSKITAEVSKAIDTLRDNGTLDELRAKWLSDYDIQELQ
jgi:polar amino acid transport system substrate-binding protein